MIPYFSCVKALKNICAKEFLTEGAQFVQRNSVIYYREKNNTDFSKSD